METNEHKSTQVNTNEFSENKWLIAIASVTFDSTETISTTCSLSCNFVTSRKRSTKGEIEVYEQPLNTFHMKTNAQASRGIFRFCELLELHKFD